ncbi:MAG: 7-cyano-7-deazaguanine synthase QueC [Cyanobacteriota bacterium]
MGQKSAVALLSGGLDSVVSLSFCLKECDVKFVVIFNYGQRSFSSEYKAVKIICEYYELSFKVVELPWLEEITTTSLVDKAKQVPRYTLEGLESDIKVLKESAKSVWVPNRNGVMLNIAASFAESLHCDYVIFGANAEEAVTFPDNSNTYVEKLNESLSISTCNAVKIYAPFAEKTKSEIVDYAIKNNVPLGFLWSCYFSGEKHCGTCESCVRLKRALNNNNQSDVWREISV